MANNKRKIAPMGLNFTNTQRPLVEALLLANDGDALIEASDELKSVVSAVREHGGKGSVTLKLVIGGSGKKVAMKMAVSSTKPKPDRPATALFADDNGRLGISDPDQYEMDDVLEESKGAAPSAPPVV